MKWLKLEFGHVLTIAAMVGSFLWVWHEGDLKATANEVNISALKAQMAFEREDRIKRDTEISDNLAMTSATLKTLADNQLRVATILQAKGLIDK